MKSMSPEAKGITKLTDGAFVSKRDRGQVPHSRMIVSNACLIT
jgi:hypothetical protein